jgi:hypothetical protein
VVNIYASGEVALPDTTLDMMQARMLLCPTVKSNSSSSPGDPKNIDVVSTLIVVVHSHTIDLKKKSMRIPKIKLICN